MHRVIFYWTCYILISSKFYHIVMSHPLVGVFTVRRYLN
jgi:hypothetical protein